MSEFAILQRGVGRGSNAAWMRKSRIYATILTALMFMALGILASNSKEPMPEVSASITVTAYADGSELSPESAGSRLRRYLLQYDPYDVSRDCLDIRAAEDDMFDVVNRCAPTAPLLGRWRVDRLTHAVVRQR